MDDIDSLFTDLFYKYYNRLIKHCINRKIREHDADDIVSEAFARAYEKAGQFVALNEKQQLTWLYSAVEIIIKERTAKAGSITVSELDSAADCEQERSVIDEFHENERYETYLREMRESLSSDKERELFEMIYDKKIDYNELAEKYDISPSTCRVMVSRFRSKIREFVNKLLNK